MMEAEDVADVDADQNTTELKRFYYHTQLIGSVTQITDEDEVVVEEYRYTPYGETTVLDISSSVVSGSQIGNPYGYTGRRMDEETGLYYYRARHYSPELGRFIQRDPLEYVDGPNAFAYVGGRVTVAVDPTGMWDQDNPFVPDDPGVDTPDPDEPIGLVGLEHEFGGRDDSCGGGSDGDGGGFLAGGLAIGWGIAIGEPTPIGEIVMTTVVVAVGLYDLFLTIDIANRIPYNPVLGTGQCMCTMQYQDGGVVAWHGGFCKTDEECSLACAFQARPNMLRAVRGIISKCVGG